MRLNMEELDDDEELSFEMLDYDPLAWDSEDGDDTDLNIILIQENVQQILYNPWI